MGKTDLVERLEIIELCFGNVAPKHRDTVREAIAYIGKDPSAGSPAAMPGYKAHLIALCEGLEIQHIDDLLTKSPAHFRELGQIMSIRIKDLKDRSAL